MILRDIASAETKVFLKSEFGPLGPHWPVVAFTKPAFKTGLQKRYVTGRDFIVFAGTAGEETRQLGDRGKLLSVAEIDTTKTYPTYNFISEKDKAWAETNYPGRWMFAFRVIKGFDVPSRPQSASVLPNTYPHMWPRMFMEIVGPDRESILDIEIESIPDVDILSKPGREPDLSDLLRPENRTLNQEALRLATLVENRVQASGKERLHRAPERTASTDLHFQIFKLLSQKPLVCALCGGGMEINAPNKLLKISGDRKDSTLGEYGPNNYQLVHLACNLAKNDATMELFEEWLTIVRGTADSDLPN
jgi:hypothetical protein